MRNIFDLPSPIPGGDELFDTLWSRPGLRVERIVSTGQRSPEGFWYDQDWDEWVCLVRGSALVSFENGERRAMTGGDFLFIPARRKHRVEETQVDPPCVWLALHADRHPDADEWIRALQLEPHPEGGYFREVYRSEERLDASALPGRYGASRSTGTSIYFLLPGNRFSAFHRLKSDEIWHHHDGCAAVIPIIDAEGNLETMRLGKNAAAGERPQAEIPRGCWFAAAPADPESYTLAGCSVAPGFEYGDFELGKREELLALFPAHRDLILRFTRPGA